MNQAICSKMEICEPLKTYFFVAVENFFTPRPSSVIFSLISTKGMVKGPTYLSDDIDAANDSQPLEALLLVG